jgi:hypothetical protein
VLIRQLDNLSWLHTLSFVESKRQSVHIQLDCFRRFGFSVE